MRSRVIARIDLKGQMVVKGRQFEGIRQIMPLEELLRRENFVGIDEIFLLDVTSSYFGVQNSLPQISQSVRQTGIPVTFEGGIKTLDDAIAVFEAGAERVSINSALYSDTNLAHEIANMYGSQALTVSISVAKTKDGWATMKNSARDLAFANLREWYEIVSELPIGEVVFSSIAKDGMLSGPDFELIAEIRNLHASRFLLSGGIRNKTEGFSACDLSGARGFMFSRSFLEGVS